MRECPAPTPWPPALPAPARGDFLYLIARLRGPFQRVLNAALACGLLLALAARPTAASFVAPGSPIRPKDFALVKQDGYYHVFYILNRAGVAATANEVALGHAISPDLYHWTQLPEVLHSDSASWNNSHVWAPSIVRKDGLWWMLYAGTTLTAGKYNDTQRMGLATSPDLMTWTRVEHPVFSATQVPWTWVDSLSAIPAFRDPCVIPDPSTPGSWLMYYTASYRPDSLADVIGVARSNGDFTSWTDVGPLLITWRGYTFNQVTESPHIFQHNGLWYLPISTTAGQPLTLYTATDPLAGVSGWTYRGRMRNMLGYDTATWFASESMRDGDRDLFAFANGDRIEFREVEWEAGWAFALVQPAYFHVLTLNWVQPSVTAAADTARLALHTANWAAGPPRFHTYVVDYLSETEVAPESLGFNASPQLASDFDTLSWRPVRWPRVPDNDTTTVTHVRIRTADGTAVSGLIAVHGPGGTPPTPGGGTGDPPGDPPKLPVLHTRSTAAGGPAAIVGMPAAAAGRVDVYDVLGRRVRNLAAGELARGTTVFEWDGRDDAGAHQSHGIYFARLVTGSRASTGRLLLLR